RYAKSVGLDSGYTILDQGDSEDIINLIRAQLDLAKLKKRFPNKQTICKVLSLSVNTSKPIINILEEDYPHFVEYSNKIIQMGEVFREYKKKNNSLDYDDLLVYLKLFLEGKSSASQNFISSIKFVMVDEYQDTNKLQADIVKALSKLNNNVMVVGDDSQSIYSFRGANFKNIMDFPSLFPNTQLIKLEENYRSTQEILNFANHIIEYAAEKYPKFLFSKIKEGELPAIISASRENMQSKFIVDRALELSEEGVPLNDIAVLFRSSYFSFDLEIELNKANIPFIKFGGMKFIETAHVKDVLAFMRIALNPRDLVSWFRVLLLHEGIGPKRAQQIMEEISQFEWNHNSELGSNISSRYVEKIKELLEVLSNLKKHFKLPAEKIEYILKYYDPLFKNKYDDFNKRRKDLDILVSIASNYQEPETFLSDMALEPPNESVADIDAEDKENEFLTLSTIHSAKGLEWHSVFVIHAVEGFFPSAQSYDSIDGLEEERRLMYVSVTRAKKNLYVCYPMNIFDRHTGFTLSKPSRFIAGIGEDLAEEWLLEEEF
ncbi:MAG: ATP-dependent helicase, partial [Bacteroidetes bacterium]|nr:ATP-dependent helicase [Bacteroidota bacterium]